VRVLPRQRVAAFACRSGEIATWSIGEARTAILAHLAESPDLIEVDRSGESLIAGGDAGTLLIVDLQTHLTTSYLGHHARISALEAGAPPSPFVVSGDEHGRIRTWPAPRRIAHRVMQQDLPMREVVFLDHSDSVVATGVTGALYAVERGAIATYGPHEAANVLISTAPAQSRFATFGLSGDVEIWSTYPLARERTLATPHGTVSQVIFLPDGQVATSGRDGQLLLWSAAGTARQLLKLEHPVTGMVFIASSHLFVVKTSNGELWRVGGGAAPSQLRAAGPTITMLQLSPDGRWIAAGDASGRVDLVDTASWQASTILRASASVRHIVFSPSVEQIAIATKDGVVHLGELRADGDVSWTDAEVPARYLAYSPTGDVLMIACTDGAVWFRSHRSQWAYVFTGAADISFARIAPDGHKAATTDFSGRVLLFDLDAIRQSLSPQQSKGTK
jgi:WD40 repeat protein